MDGRQRSDVKPENERNADDDEVIDLTQIVEGDDDDEIIELTTILDQPDQAPEREDAVDDAVISLENVVAPETADDDIIDLMDVTTPDAPQASRQPLAEDVAFDEGDEDVIDLTETVPLSAEAPDDATNGADGGLIDLRDLETTLESEIAELEADRAEPASPPDDRNALPSEEEADEVIDLLEVSDVAPEEMAAPEDEPEEALADFDDEPLTTAIDTDTLNAELPIELSEMSADAAPSSADEAVVAPVGAIWPEPAPRADVDVPPVVETDRPPTAPDTPPLSEAQVAAALERVIEKVYGDRIEALLIETIEKTVRQEIEKIKSALTAEDDTPPA